MNTLFSLYHLRNMSLASLKSVTSSLAKLAIDERFYISTPIFYVNAAPHIGHAYTSVLTDVMARYQKIKGKKVLYATGTDEHGLKIQQAATANNEDPKKYCDGISDQFKEAIQICECDYDDYIRTTEERHEKVVQKIWTILEEKGHIYKGSYEGWYCVSDEDFLTETQTKEVPGPDGKPIRVSADSERPVELFREENYKFRLSAFQKDLLKWLENESVVKPVQFRGDVIAWLTKEELPDLSISRPIDRLKWGIPVPSDPSHNIYVWLDALFNYLTIAGYPDEPYVWPPNIQVIGKDILKFHAIYWPAFLIAAGFEPPKQLLVHCHWTVEGQKMSKSIGNVVNVVEAAERVSPTALRYFLLRQGVPGSDNDFSMMQLINVANSDLADNLGNLLQRCTGPAINVDQIAPSIFEADFHALGQEGTDLFNSLVQLPDKVSKRFDDFEFYMGLQSIMLTLKCANIVMQSKKPWELKKQNKMDDVYLILGACVETLRVVGIMMQPIVPSLSSKLLDRLNVDASQRTWNHAIFTEQVEKRPLGADQTILFKRIAEAQPTAAATNKPNVAANGPKKEKQEKGPSKKEKKEKK